MADENSSDKNVEMWKVKKLIKSLQAARGNGTSMISLIIPPGDQVSTSVLITNPLINTKYMNTKAVEIGIILSIVDINIKRSCMPFEKPEAKVKLF